MKSIPRKGLLVKSHGHLSVEGYYKADWEGCLDDRRSTSGYCVFVGENLIYLRRKRKLRLSYFCWRKLDILEGQKAIKDIMFCWRKLDILEEQKAINCISTDEAEYRDMSLR